MKRIAPNTGSKARVIGGCRLPKHAPIGLHFKDFIHAAALPTPPATADYSAKALTVIENIEGNDQYGDCVMAEDAHAIALLTGNANTLFAYTEAQTLADYSALTGFNASVPSSDQGTDPIADLNWRVQHGYVDGSKDAGWALVDATNQQEVELALAEFGNLKMWFGIPASIVNAMPDKSGFVWDITAGAPDSENGHCIGGAGYNVTKVLAVGVTAQGILIMTWGMLGVVTWAAVKAWFVSSQGGGLAVRVNMDWVSKASGITPSGVNAAALVTAFNSYFGGKLPVPSPAPTPPSPTPPAPSTGLITVVAADAALTAAFKGAHALLTKGQALTLATGAIATVPVSP